MKISKFFMRGGVLALSLLTIMSCKEADDVNEMIEKVSSKEFRIDYANSTGTLSRGYCSTGTKHSGGLFVVEMENQSADQPENTGLMGVIFDLQDSKNNDGKDFYIIGFNYGSKGYKGQVGYYCSKFRNITDLNGDNFGVKKIYKTTELADFIKTTDPAELDLTGGFQHVALKPNANGTIKVAIDVSMANGEYTINVYKESALTEKNELKSSFVSDDYLLSKDSVKIEQGITLYTDPKDAEKQGLLAVYANVRPDKRLTGTWLLPKVQNYVQVIEE